MQTRFAAYVFGFDKMEERLPPNVFKKFKKTVDEKKGLDPEVADALATEIKKWEESMGVTHYTHWFLPLTGLTAGKQLYFDLMDYNYNTVELHPSVMSRYVWHIGHATDPVKVYNWKKRQRTIRKKQRRINKIMSNRVIQGLLEDSSLDQYHSHIRA